MDPNDGDPPTQLVTDRSEKVHVARDEYDARVRLAARQQTHLTPQPLLKLTVCRLGLWPGRELLDAGML